MLRQQISEHIKPSLNLDMDDRERFSKSIFIK
jgi:hypothetical protein